MFLFVFFDYIVVIQSSDTLVQSFIDRIGEEFMIRLFGGLNFFLGIKVAPIASNLHLNHLRYLCNLLQSCDIDNLLPSTMPMITNQGFASNEKPISNYREYHQVVGSLQYLAITRFDIQFIANKLSRFMISPQLIHQMAMEKVIIYLSGLQQFGINLDRVKSFLVQGLLTNLSH